MFERARRFIASRATAAASADRSPEISPGLASVWPPRRPGRRRLLVHAGLHKTGTTAIQEYLAPLASALRARGVLYPAAGRPGGALVGHHNIAWQLAGDRRFRARHGDLDAVAGEIADFDGDAVVSSEDFETALCEPRRLLPLLRHAALAEHDVTVLVYLRDQASYLESLFFEMLHHGLAEEPARLCETVLRHGELRHADWSFLFDPARLLDEWAALAPARLVLRGYAPGAAVTDLLGLLGCAALAGEAATERRGHDRQTLAESFAQFCAARQHWARADADPHLQPVLQAALGGRAAGVSAEQRAALIRRFAAGNRRIAQAAGFAPGLLEIAPRPPAGALALDRLFTLSAQAAAAELVAQGALQAPVARLQALLAG